MVEGRGEYGRSIGAGARQKARPCVPRGLCDSEAMPTEDRPEHGATRGRGDDVGPLGAVAGNRSSPPRPWVPSHVGYSLRTRKSNRMSK